MLFTVQSPFTSFYSSFFLVFTSALCQVRGYYEDTSRLGVYYEAAGNMTNFYAYSADALKAKTDAFVQKQRQEAAMVLLLIILTLTTCLLFF